MGNWHIGIHGIGSHHNHDNPHDVNKLVAEFVDKLKAAGHSVTHAHLHHGGAEDMLDDKAPTRAGAFGPLAVAVTGLALLLAAFGWNAPARAADLGGYPAKAPYQPAYVGDPWSGWYIGADLGHAWDTSGQNGLITNANASMFFDSLTTAPQGLTGGVFIGAGMKCLGFLYCGIESDIQAAAMHAAGGVGTSGLSQDFAINGDTKQTLYGSTRARVGLILPLNIPLMVYATGGVAYADMSGNVTINNITGASAGGSVGTSQWKTGAAYGLGAEFAFAPNWTARAQWIRYGTGKVTTSVPIVDAAGTPTGAVGNFKFGGEIDAVTGGIAYHF